MTREEVAARLNAGVALHRAGDVAGAGRSYEAVLRARPSDADALHLLGLVAQQQGDLEQACRLIEASIATRPTAPRVHFNLAILRAARGNDEGAIVAYEAAIALDPNFAEALSNVGNHYVLRGRPDDALQAYEKALLAKPDFIAVRCNLGKLFVDIGRYEAAIEILETARQFAPEVPEIHANLGQAYRRSGRFHEAISASQRALAIRPEYASAQLNLALANSDIDAVAAAIEANERALVLAPSSADVHCNRARVFHMAGRYLDAIGAAEAAIAVRPDYAEAHVNLAVSLLVRGDFARGWSEYGWMWRVPSRRSSYPYLDRVPLWNGEPFAGRQLVVTPDQGFGDALQMVRYLPAVKARGGRVVLETQPALAPLFEALPGVDELRVSAVAPAGAGADDLHIPLLGLPGAMGTDLGSIPASIPYLRAAPERVQRWLPRFEQALRHPQRPRVGIAWAGSGAHANDHRRSVDAQLLEPLGKVTGIEWFGLQKGRRDEARRSVGPLALEPLGAQIGDFADSAAIMTYLDLVISVDTAIVHLAGALGKPVWTLLPFAPDWRWLLERTDSPWYPTLRLFRQPHAGDWAAVIAAVAVELERLVSTFSRRG